MLYKDSVFLHVITIILVIVNDLNDSLLNQVRALADNNSINFPLRNVEIGLMLELRRIIVG